MPLKVSFSVNLAVVHVDLVKTQIRIMEDNGSVEVCVTKDLETVRNFFITLEVLSGTAQGEEMVNGLNYQ